MSSGGVSKEISGMKWVKNSVEGSNAHRISENLACNLEIFFAAVANSEINLISLERLLYLFTGLRKIPPFGLHKLIFSVTRLEHRKYQLADAM